MTAQAQKTAVDYFRFRTQADICATLDVVRPMFGQYGGALRFVHLPRGMNGFEQAAQVQIGDKVLGRVDFGGEHQRGWVRWDIPGKGCEWVEDWSGVQDIEAHARSELKRLDIALTTWNGEVTHERVVEAHGAGRFASHRAGGRPPSMRQILPSDPRDGRTVYIGARTADKFARCYEKGWEMARSLPEDLRQGLTSIDGYPPQDIYRCELELKASERPIPWEVVLRRDQYFAGSYPFFGDILPGVEVDILTRLPDRAPRADLAAMLAQVNHQYGAALFTALHAYQGDIGAVWERIVGDRHHRGLLEAGVLLVDHDSERLRGPFEFGMQPTTH